MRGEYEENSSPVQYDERGFMEEKQVEIHDAAAFVYEIGDACCSPM